LVAEKFDQFGERKICEFTSQGHDIVPLFDIAIYAGGRAKS